MKSLWDLIDAVYVINMDYRPDRWAELQQEASGIIPAHRLHRISGVVGVDLPGYGAGPWFAERTGKRGEIWAGVGGCTLSHRKAIEAAQKDGCRYALILEDDVSFRPDEGASALLARFLENDPGGWGLLYPGFHGMPPFGELYDQEGSHELWRLPGVIAAHAYIVSADSCQALLDHLPTPETIWPWLARFRAVDNYYRDHLTHDTGLAIYGLVPSWAVQRPSWSDLGQKQVDYSQSFTPNRKPLPFRSPGGVWWRCLSPFRRLKIKLNGMRTFRRARYHGFPGEKKGNEPSQGNAPSTEGEP